MERARFLAVDRKRPEPVGVILDYVVYALWATALLAMLGWYAW